MILHVILALAAWFFALISIPLVIDLGIQLIEVIFRGGVWFLAAAGLLIRRMIHALFSALLDFARNVASVPRDLYNTFDHLLQWMAPPTLAGFRVEYSTLEYYTRTTLRSLTLEQHLRWHGYPPAGRSL